MALLFKWCMQIIVSLVFLLAAMNAHLKEFVVENIQKLDNRNELINAAAEGNDSAAAILYKHYYWVRGEKEKALGFLSPAINDETSFRSRSIYAACHLDSGCIQAAELEKIKSALYLESVINNCDDTATASSAAYVLAEYFNQNGDQNSVCYYEKSAFLGNLYSAKYLRDSTTGEVKDFYKKLYSFILKHDYQTSNNYRPEVPNYIYGSAVFYDIEEYNLLKKILAEGVKYRTCKYIQKKIPDPVFR